MAGKRKRCVGFDDYIKEDGVLLMIVSKLPIREAIRTSVLSRRWRYIWNHMPNLHLTLCDISPTYSRNIPHFRSSFRGCKSSILYKTAEFVHAVDAVLIQHCGSGVETFKIKFSFQKQHSPSVDKWLDFALASDTKSLDLSFHESECPNSYFDAFLKWMHSVPGFEPYNFPFHKLLQQNRSSSTLSSIHTLRLGYCSLQVPSSDCNCLPFLKTIDLYYLKLTDLDFENLLSICPDIEHLSVYGCPWLVNMSIHQQSGRLKHLSVRNCWSLERLHIQVACLATFEYQGGEIALFTDVSHITKASFQLNFKCAKFGITELSSHLPRCQDLTLEFDHGQVYCPTAELINKFEHLKHLTVRVKYLDVYYIKLLFKILKAAPVLEKFELQLLYLKKLYIQELPLEGEYLPHEYLKEVNIIGFAGTMEQITFVRSLLRNLLSLSTMRIIVQLQQFIDLKLNFVAREVIFDGVLAFDYLRSVAPPRVDLVLQYPILSESGSRMLQSLRSSTHQVHKLGFSN